MSINLSKSVIYQIYLRTFTAEGTLKAAEKMIPHLSDLGIDIIYLSVCNKEDTSEEHQSTRQIDSGMNNIKNPYRISDYFDIDEEFGTMEDLKDFVDTAHQYGLKVLYDLVYAHCGHNAVFADSHPNFFKRNEEGEIVGVEDCWPFAGLNYDDFELREYMWSIMEFYIKDIKVDGFRCDVADAVPLDFWAEGTERIRKINPDAIMLNEGSNFEYFKAFDAEYIFDAIYMINNVFLNPNNSLVAIKNTRTSNIPDVNATDLKKLLTDIYDKLPENKYVLCNSENHDTVSDLYDYRPEMLLGSDAAQAIMAIIFTLKGIPMIYNGCEVADSTEKNMFWNRFSAGTMSVQWQNALTEKGRNRLDFVKKCISLHRHNDAVSDGKLDWVNHDNEENIICYQRASEKEKVTVAVNVTGKVQTLNIPIKGKNIFSQKIVIKDNYALMKPYGFIIIQEA